MTSLATDIAVRRLPHGIPRGNVALGKEGSDIMFVEAGLEDYAEELEQQVCRRCVARVKGAPPCAPMGIGCGVEQHVKQLVEICHSVDSPLIDPYQDALKEKVCADCIYRDDAVCPCPLKYLLPLAISAVETVDRRRRQLGQRLARAFCCVQDTD